MLEAIGGVIASNRSVEGWDIHSTAPCISPHYFTLLFYLCLKILLEALSIDFFFFFFLTLAETLGLRKIDLVKVSWLAGVQGPSGHDSAESRI